MPIEKTDQAVCRTFRLSSRLSAEITAGSGGMVVEWIPGAPERLTAKELQAYRRARSEVMAALAEIVGGAVVVVEA